MGYRAAPFSDFGAKEGFYKINRTQTVNLIIWTKRGILYIIRNGVYSFNTIFRKITDFNDDYRQHKLFCILLF